MAKQPTFSQVLNAAINDVVDHGFDKAERMEKWLEKLRKAAVGSLPSEKQMDQMLRDALVARYRKLVDGGEIAKLNPGVSRYTIKALTPKMKDELTKRIMASSQLIKLNRQRSIDATLQRFSGWMSSVPAGGTDQTNKKKTKDEVKKALSSLPFEERRVLIDQSTKLVASINEVVAVNTGAIAGEWVSHHLQPGYDFREEHAERAGHIYLIRDSWAHKQGLVKASKVGFTDSITKPAEEPFCLPGDARIDLFEDARKIYRRSYEGPMVTVTTASGSKLRTTPNHPVLTPDGWTAAGLLQEGDKVVEVSDESIFAPELNGNKAKSTFSNVFQAALESGTINELRHGMPMHFHGDGTNDDINIITLNRPLPMNIEATIGERLGKLILSITNFLPSRIRSVFKDRDSFLFSSEGRMGFSASDGSMMLHSLTQSSIINFDKPLHDGWRRYSKSLGQISRIFASLVAAKNIRTINFNFLEVCSARTKINDAVNMAFPQGHGTDTNGLSYLFETKPTRTKLVDVINVDRNHFTGHVYNLETDSGWFSGNSVIVSNCRCYYRYIYAISALPSDMLTAKGKAALAEARAKLAS